MATDIDRQFPHYTPPLRQLLEKSYNVANCWRHKPRKNAKAYEAWEKNLHKRLHEMSEIMVLFGLEVTDDGAKKSK